MKFKILATTCYSSEIGAQLTEAAQTGQGLDTFCLGSNIFETNPENELVRFENHLLTSGIGAVIFDNFGLPGRATGITVGQIEFAKRMHGRGVESFFLCRGNEPNNNLGCELWRAHKPIGYPDMEMPSLSLVRVGIFVRGEVFDMKTGKVYPRSGGDGGQAQVHHAIRNFLAFNERDWPQIVEVVKRELVP